MPSQAAAKRRLQFRADAQRAILNAAEELLVEGGLESFSMRGLADRCGYTAPTIYHYFEDKAQLIHELLEERLQSLVTELRAVTASNDAVAHARDVCLAFAGFSMRNPSHYQLLVLDRGADTPEPPSSEEAQRLCAEPLERLVSTGELPERELEPLKQGLWSLLHGIILLRATRPDEDWAPDLLETSLDALIRGWLAREGDAA